MRGSTRLGPLLALGVSMGTLGNSSPAHACGGFFCNQSAPVLQAAERIIFASQPDGRISTIVQVSYTGTSTSFSWVVPVPGVPDVGVSSNTIFNALEGATAPRFRLEFEDTCRTQNPGDETQGIFDASVSVDAGSSAPTVDVLASGSVGPYDYEVIRPNPALPDAASVAVQWLDDNGYDVSAIGPDLLRPYLAMNQNLIGFRLNPSARVGDIRPVMLTYEAERPLIPIKLTGVAARSDMGVYVYVFGQHRAVPLNYLSLEPNLALVDWGRSGSNWSQVVSAAADQAGGQGFATEYAGSSAGIVEDLWGPQSDTWLRGLAERDWSGAEFSLVQELNQRMRGWDGFLGVLEQHVPVPADTTLRDYLNCPLCYGAEPGALPGVDPVAVLAAVEESVVAPLRETVQRLDQPYLTRLYTTLSPEEMTLDPTFDQNPDLGPVDNVHRAVARRDGCDRPFLVTLEDGRILLVNDPYDWPLAVGAAPANRRVHRAGLEGPLEIVADYTSDRSLEARTASSSSSCASVSPRDPSLLLLGLGLLALALRRRQSR